MGNKVKTKSGGLTKSDTNSSQAQSKEAPFLGGNANFDPFLTSLFAKSVRFPLDREELFSIRGKIHWLIRNCLLI